MQAACSGPPPQTATQPQRIPKGGLHENRRCGLCPQCGLQGRHASLPWRSSATHRRQLQVNLESSEPKYMPSSKRRASDELWWRPTYTGRNEVATARQMASRSLQVRHKSTRTGLVSRPSIDGDRRQQHDHRDRQPSHSAQRTLGCECANEGVLASTSSTSFSPPSEPKYTHSLLRTESGERGLDNRQREGGHPMGGKSPPTAPLLVWVPSHRTAIGVISLPPHRYWCGSPPPHRYWCGAAP